MLLALVFFLLLLLLFFFFVFCFFFFLYLFGGSVIWWLGGEVIMAVPYASTIPVLKFKTRISSSDNIKSYPIIIHCPGYGKGHLSMSYPW